MNFFHSLRNMLTLNFIIFGVLPIVILGMIALNLVTHQMERELTQHNFLLAKAVAGEVEKHLQTHLKTLNQVKTIVNDRKMIDPAQINDYLETLIEIYPTIESIMLLDAQGKIKHCSPCPDEFSRMDMSNQPFFKLARKNHTPCWSSTAISMYTGQPTLCLSLHLENGVAVSHLNLAALRQITDKIDPEQNEEIAIIDTDGTIIAHSDPSLVTQRVNVNDFPGVRQALSGKEGTYSYKFRGRTKLASAVIIPATGWVAAVLLPMEVVHSAIRPVHKLLWSGMAITALLAVISSVIMQRKTLKPLAQMTEHAGKIAKGDYCPLPEKQPYHELQSLAQASNAMIRAINARENAIRQSETRYRSLYQSLMDGFICMDMDGTITESNKAFQTMIDYGAQELSALSYLDLTPEKWLPLERSIISDQVLPRGYSDVYEKEYCRKDGTLFSVEIRMLLLKNDNNQNQGMWAIVRDITEKKKMQETMIHTEKMLSLGGIAAGVAHEINNPLGIVVQAVQNLVLRTRPDFAKNQEVAKSLGMEMEMVAAYMKARKVDLFIEHIQSGAVRAADIVRHMLDFTRHSQSKHCVCDIRQIIEEAMNLVRNDYELKKSYDFKRIDTQITAAPDFPQVLCNKTQLEQVFLNLFRNAAQAIGESCPPLDAPRIEVRLTHQQQRIHIEVEDNGPGVPLDIQHRIFEPFFTTKPPGIGTGLGLSVSYFMITTGHNGLFFVDSVPGEGTCFTIELPRTVQEEKGRQAWAANRSG